MQGAFVTGDTPAMDWPSRRYDARQWEDTSRAENSAREWKINKNTRYMKSKTTNKDIFTLEVAEDVTQRHKSWLGKYPGNPYQQADRMIRPIHQNEFSGEVPWDR